MIHPFRIWPTCLLLPAYLLASTIGLYGFVLCFEIDGDIVLESAPFGLNCEPEISPPGTVTDGYRMDTASSHCGTCVDQPLGVSLSVERPAKFSGGALVGDTALNSPFYLPLRLPLVPASVHYTNTLLHHDETLGALRAVVLLI